jgi:hypothetical protein
MTKQGKQLRCSRYKCNIIINEKYFRQAALQSFKYLKNLLQYYHVKIRQVPFMVSSEKAGS